MAFTDEQLERYSRHIILKEVGVKGQKKLLNGKVLIIGAGGLGAPAALYLAAAGVGTIGIADADEVDLSNLQRQVIHTTADIGKAKVKSAKETMEAINPDVKVNTYRKFIKADNIREIIREYDFVIDGTDNFPVKFLINDACRDHPFQRSADDICTWRRSMLPLRIPEPATGRCSSDLQTGRRYRRNGRRYRKSSGNGSHQIPSWRWGSAHRKTADIRCADYGIPYGKITETCTDLRSLRRSSDHHRTDRLRAEGM